MGADTPDSSGGSRSRSRGVADRSLSFGGEASTFSQGGRNTVTQGQSSRQSNDSDSNDIQNQNVITVPVVTPDGNRSTIDLSFSVPDTGRVGVDGSGSNDISRRGTLLDDGEDEGTPDAPVQRPVDPSLSSDERRRQQGIGTILGEALLSLADTTRKTLLG